MKLGKPWLNRKPWIAMATYLVCRGYGLAKIIHQENNLIRRMALDIVILSLKNDNQINREKEMKAMIICLCLMLALPAYGETIGEWIASDPPIANEEIETWARLCTVVDCSYVIREPRVIDEETICGNVNAEDCEAIKKAYIKLL